MLGVRLLADVSHVILRSGRRGIGEWSVRLRADVSRDTSLRPPRYQRMERPSPS